MATKKHDLGVVTDLFQNGGQIRREFKLGRFLAVIEKTYPNRTLVAIILCIFTQKTFVGLSTAQCTCLPRLSLGPTVLSFFVIKGRL